MLLCHTCSSQALGDICLARAAELELVLEVLFTAWLSGCLGTPKDSGIPPCNQGQALL